MIILNLADKTNYPIIIQPNIQDVSTIVKIYMQYIKPKRKTNIGSHCRKRAHDSHSKIGSAWMGSIQSSVNQLKFQLFISNQQSFVLKIYIKLYHTRPTMEFPFFFFGSEKILNSHISKRVTLLGLQLCRNFKLKAVKSIRPGLLRIHFSLHINSLA